MARTAELALTSTDGATSTGFAVAAGASVTVGMYVASGDIPLDAQMDVLIATPGADTLVCVLSRAKPSTGLQGPVTLYKLRLTNASSVAIGGFLDA